jgi:hypothetical protein
LSQRLFALTKLGLREEAPIEAIFAVEEERNRLMTSQTANPSPAPAASTATPATESRTRRRPATVLGKLGETLAALFALAVAGGLWYLGAQFILLALAAIGIPVAELGHWRWLIPAGISAVELRWWPRAIAEAKAISFAVVALLDGASTLYGLVLWGAGRTLPLATGISIPHDGLGLVVPALLAALLLAFVPERLTLRMLSELRMIWSA